MWGEEDILKHAAEVEEFTQAAAGRRDVSGRRHHAQPEQYG